MPVATSTTCLMFGQLMVNYAKQCPRWCGPSPMDTSHLRGLFISIPAVRQQELANGQTGCLDVWRFEGTIFQLYRTGLHCIRFLAKPVAILRLTVRLNVDRNEFHIVCTDAIFTEPV